MKVQGYNGSMAWDTSFAMQAAVEADLVLEFKERFPAQKSVLSWDMFRKCFDIHPILGTLSIHIF